MSILHSTPFYTLYLCRIDTSDGLSRRECELRASARLITEAFGPDAKLDHTENGAPFIADRPETAISLSHCESYCALALGHSDAAIGIDIEIPRRQLLRVAPRFLAPSEISATELHSIEQAGLSFLLKLWTIKEAVYKAALTPGLGLAEIVTADDFTHATARGKKYATDFHSLPTGEFLTVAVTSV